MDWYVIFLMCPFVSFCWILANPKGQWLNAASSPSMEWGISCCAEGYDILTGALLLFIITEKYLSKDCTIKYILDNFCFVIQNNEHLEYNISDPNTTLWADYDVIKHIY